MVRRVIAVGLMAFGLVLALLGWRLLPRDAGRLAYAIEIADPRPLSESVMPAGLKAFGAVRVVSVGIDSGDRGVTRLLLLPNPGVVLTAADTDLGGIPGPAAAGPRKHLGLAEAVAGANTSLELGRTTVGGMMVEIVGRLCPLGAAFDSSVLVADAREGSVLEGRASVRYLLLPGNWEERRRMLARLRAELTLPTGLEAEVVGSAESPPLSRRTRLTAAGLLICLGAAVMALQMRGLTRADVARGLRRP